MRIENTDSCFSLAAATDAKLREQGLIATNVGITSETMTYEQQQDRLRSIQDIEGGAFVQQSFSGSKQQVSVVASRAARLCSSHSAAVSSR